MPQAPKPAEKPKVAEHLAKPIVAKPVAATITVAEEAPVKKLQEAVVVPTPAPKVKKVVVPKAVKVSKPKPAPIKSEAAPTVMIAYRGDVKPREAKGFSYGELRAAGVTKEQALRSGLRVDSRRKTSHHHNMKLLESIKPKAA
jgi:ribosomal protein L13E